MNEAAKYIGIGAVGAWVLGAAFDIIVYAAGIAALIGLGTWFYATAIEHTEDENGDTNRPS